MADYHDGQSLDEGDDTMDAAIARLRPEFGSSAVADICGIGRPSGVDRVSTIGVRVRKSGAMTGLSRGIVTDYSYNPTVHYGSVIHQAYDQMRIEAHVGRPPFAEEGDSGSVVVLEDQPGWRRARDWWRLFPAQVCGGQSSAGGT